MGTDLKQFEEQIKRDIPLAVNLHFEFANYRETSLELKAPYLPNKNDKETVFAGSQASLALLAGWSLVTLYFKKCDAEIVAAVKTEMHYQAPIEKDFIVQARFSEPEKLSLLEDQIKSKGRAKVNIEVVLKEPESEKPQAIFSGSYFVSK
jgi:thioesterase domain-containing protein